MSKLILIKPLTGFEHALSYVHSQVGYLDTYCSTTEVDIFENEQDKIMRLFFFGNFLFHFNIFNLFGRYHFVLSERFELSGRNSLIHKFVCFHNVKFGSHQKAKSFDKKLSGSLLKFFPPNHKVLVNLLKFSILGSHFYIVFCGSTIQKKILRVL